MKLTGNENFESFTDKNFGTGIRIFQDKSIIRTIWHEFKRP